MIEKILGMTFTTSVDTCYDKETIKRGDHP